MNISAEAGFQRQSPPGQIINRFLHRFRTNVRQRFKPSHDVLTIPLKDQNLTKHGEFYIGDRKRLATCTSVKFIGNNRLVAGHMVGRYLSLIKFDIDNQTHEVLDYIETSSAGNLCSTDLLDFDQKDALITSNCESNSASLYEIVGDSIVHRSDLIIDKDLTGFAHGAAFIPWDESLVCVATTTNQRNVIILDRETHQVRYTINDGDWKPKDVCFPGSNQMIVAYSYFPATPQNRVKGTDLMTKLSWFGFDEGCGSHHVISETYVDNCQADSCVFKNGHLYLPNQNRDIVHVFKESKNKLRLQYDILGFDFPHGIDVHREQNLLAVTNYGSNTISIRNLR